MFMEMLSSGDSAIKPVASHTRTSLCILSVHTIALSDHFNDRFNSNCAGICCFFLSSTVCPASSTKERSRSSLTSSCTFFYRKLNTCRWIKIKLKKCHRWHSMTLALIYLAMTGKGYNMFCRTYVLLSNVRYFIYLLEAFLNVT